MKEAAGEANMTVITIILIGVIAAVAIPLINSLMTNTQKRTECHESGGYWDNGTCVGGDTQTPQS
ncbi:MAG TPA: hypothetical protein IAC20_02650 [Candidatus Faecisoma merdavium]|nr:hypothetical protein [Candidatus Faecisoma merdavium]